MPYHPILRIIVLVKRIRKTEQIQIKHPHRIEDAIQMITFMLDDSGVKTVRIPADPVAELVKTLIMYFLPILEQPLSCRVLTGNLPTLHRFHRSRDE